MLKRYTWGPAPAIGPATLRLASDLGVSPLLARLLQNRGCDSAEAARAFLEPGISQIEDPSLMAGMAEAVSAVLAVVDGGGKILVYGDYDVDGLCAASLMVSFLKAAGAGVEAYIPHRLDEGYGLNPAALNQAKEKGFDLVLTVDCGISALEEATLAASLGLDLVVTDHHQPRPELPCARAVVNPLRPDCPYPNKHLSGVGVALKLVQALAASLEGSGRPAPPGGWPQFALSFCDLVALGSVADVVPLLGENRSLVRLGLEQINRAPRAGLWALLEAAGWSGGRVCEYHLGYLLSPRLNACGRMGRLPPDTGLALLTAPDPRQATDLALALNRENHDRQKEETAVLAAALSQLEEGGGLGDSFMIAAGDDWHPGVLGIVAARLVDRFGRPAAVISWQGGGEGRGSVRSPAGFLLPPALSACSDLLGQFGGHAGAAGLTVVRECFPELKERLNLLAAGMAGPAGELPRIVPEAELKPEEISLDLAEAIEALAPFGAGNPQPVFLARDLAVIESRRIGRNQDHLRLRLAGSRAAALEAVAFRCWFDRDPASGDLIDLLFDLQIDTWKDRRRPKALIKDLSTSELQIRYRELSEAAPQRETLVSLYRQMKEACGDGQTISQQVLLEAFGNHPRGTLQTALAVFSELGLIEPEREGWRVIPNPPKTALENSREYLERRRRFQRLELL